MSTKQYNKLPEISFIVGMGRSGTTLLTNMLNSHPNIIATPENEFILFTQTPFFKKDFNKLSVVNNFLNTFNYNFNKVFSVWKPLPNIKEDIINLPEKKFTNVCKAVYLNYPFIGNKQNVKYIIDKNPDYSLHINKLKKIFPNAKYIVLTRDFRDNILSRKNHSKGTSIYDLASAWNYYYKNIYSSIKNLGISHYFLRYEDLTANPKETLQGLCTYLGIEYDEAMLQFQQSSKEIIDHVKQTESDGVYNKIISMHSNLKNEVNTTRVKAYEKELSPKEISILNYACFKYGKNFNYIKQKEKDIKLIWILKINFSLIKIKIYYSWRNIYYKLPISLRYIFLKKL